MSELYVCFAFSFFSLNVLDYCAFFSLINVMLELKLDSMNPRHLHFPCLYLSIILCVYRRIYAFIFKLDRLLQADKGWYLFVTNAINQVFAS